MGQEWGITASGSFGEAKADEALKAKERSEEEAKKRKEEGYGSLSGQTVPLRHFLSGWTPCPLSNPPRSPPPYHAAQSTRTGSHAAPPELKGLARRSHGPGCLPTSALAVQILRTVGESIKDELPCGRKPRDLGDPVGFRGLS
ncbi:hypothetical protein UY3_10145 [Chelonia mydas]|uniref:Uncharacterized protein n=1 Tax=Chelonia mydas TaxID=8469 RepID=M7B493_CHEMY|nr:hypothetical protein UY3_10145 [Chelonia mydas]